MKNILTKLALTIITLLMLAPLTYAGSIDEQVDNLLPRPGEGVSAKDAEYAELSAVGDLPKVTIESAMTSIIKTILQWAMVITLIAFGAVMALKQVLNQ